MLTQVAGSKRIAVHTERKLAALRSAASLNAGTGIPDYPLALYLEISNLCNFKCAFCVSFSAINPLRFKMLKQVDRGFLELDNIGSNIDELFTNALAVYLFGYGEPTIHPQFLDLIRYAGSFETQIEFVTNGLELTEELSRELIQQRVFKVSVSFSGANKADYENVYLNGSFERVTGNLKALARLKRDMGSKYPQVLINSIAFKHHIASLPEFVDLMADCGANIINVNALTVHAAFPELYRHAEVYSPEKHAPLMAEVRRRAETRGILMGMDAFERQAAQTDEDETRIRLSRVSGQLAKPEQIPEIPIARIPEYARSIRPERADNPPPKLSEPPTSRSEAAARLNLGAVEGPDGPFYCFEPFRTAYIRRDGNVKPCCLWPDTDLHFGNINTQTGADIWRGRTFETTRAAILGGVYPEACSYCIKSRVAPPDPQLGLIYTFAEWYHHCYGINLLDRLGFNGVFHSPKAIVSSLLGTAIPGWSEVELLAAQQYGWDDRLDAIRERISSGEANVVVVHLDPPSHGGICGWAWCPSEPDIHFRVELVAEGNVIAQAVAVIDRPDIAASTTGRGNYGFFCASVRPRSELVSLEVRIPAVGFISAPFVFPLHADQQSGIFIADDERPAAQAEADGESASGRVYEIAPGSRDSSRVTGVLKRLLGIWTRTSHWTERWTRPQPPSREHPAPNQRP